MKTNNAEITSEEEYLKVLKRLEAIFDAHPNTEDGEELERLVKLIEIWENKNYPIT